MAASPPVVESSSDSGSISSGLLQGMKEARHASWESFVHLYGPVIYRWIERRGLSPDDAADVGQEVFRAVAVDLDRFRRTGPLDTFMGWLRGITTHKVADFLRAYGKQPHGQGGSTFHGLIAAIPDPAIEPHGDDPLEGTDDARRDVLEGTAEVVRRALSQVREHFTETSYRAFWLTVVEGADTADVAESLRMSAMAVRQAKSRVLRRLREVLSHDCDKIDEA